MSPIGPITDWSATLRGLAAGVSMSVLFLVPQNDLTPISGHALATQNRMNPTMSATDGTLDQGIFFYSTGHGLGTLRDDHSTTVPRPALQSKASAEQDRNPAWSLRDVSALPVEVLAEIMNVSRNSFQKWLRGEGMNPIHAACLHDLIPILQTLREIRGHGLQNFLESSLPIGRPIDLLRAGDVEAVVGMALRPPEPETVLPRRTSEARRISGINGWTQVVRPLGWSTARQDHGEREMALERLSPRLLPNDSTILLVDNEDDALAFVTSLLVEG